MNRRGFIGSLLALPAALVAAKAVPAPRAVDWSVYDNINKTIFDVMGEYQPKNYGLGFTFTPDEIDNYMIARIMEAK